MDWYIDNRIWLWLRKKYPKATVRQIKRFKKYSKRYPTYKVWTEKGTEQFLLNKYKVERYRRGWMRTPDFVTISGEPDT